MTEEKPRRPKGTGSIAFRESENRYQGLLRVHGESRYVYGKTYDEVDTALRHLAADVERDRAGKKRAPLTVEDYLNDWLAKRVKGKRQPSTYRGYKSYVDNHLVPGLGSRQLAKLTPSDVQALIDKTKLSPRSIQQMRAVLRAALANAERVGLVDRNVAKLTEGPPVRKHQVQPLTPIQAKVFLAAIREDQHEAVYAVAIGCGLRLGETLGLRWWTGTHGVNLEDGYLVVAEELQRVDGKYILKEVKTEESNRTVMLPGLVRDALQRQIVRQEGQKKLAEKEERPWPETWGLVFTTDRGQPVNGSWVTHRLYGILKNKKLPRQSTHDLRHCFASVLIAEGADLKEVKDVLGHSQVSLTANLYGHIYDGTRKAAAARIQKALG